MKKINYVLNENNVIIDWTRVPFDANKPFIELADDIEIHVGFDKIINGEFIADAESYAKVHAAEQANAVKALRIYELKSLLTSTDYLCLKHADGALTDEEYASTKAQRQAWRDEINSLEAE